MTLAKEYYPSMRDKRNRRQGRNFSAKVDVRLDRELDNILDILSKRNGASRSDIMRKSLLDFYKFNTLDEDD